VRLCKVEFKCETVRRKAGRGGVRFFIAMGSKGAAWHTAAACGEYLVKNNEMRGKLGFPLSSHTNFPDLPVEQFLCLNYR
jgi:hypothetical protein